jgi:small subunit ribosomal protein S23
LLNPPPILPARKVVRQAQGKKQGLQKIVYEEDKIRRQFFKDFPFEALRPTSLVEGFDIKPEDEIVGETWTVLSQRGAYPSVER